MRTLLVCGFMLAVMSGCVSSPGKIVGLGETRFGETPEQVKAAMDARGAVLNGGSATVAHLEFKGGSFNNEPAAYWHFYFSEAKVYKASVAFHPPANASLERFDEIKRALSDEYGKPFQQTRVSMRKEEILRRLCQGEITLEANWREVTPRPRSISCSVFRRSATDVFIRVVYQDDLMASRIAAKEEKDF